MKKLPTIQFLRDNGWKVQVRHHRRWKFNPPADVEIMRHQDPNQVSQMKEGGQMRMPGWELQQKGGRTEVILESPPVAGVGVAVRIAGVAHCSKSDQYNKKSGRTRAMRRALDAFRAQTGLEVTSALICDRSYFDRPRISPPLPEEDFMSYASPETQRKRVLSPIR